jgi:CO dehydrogenase/acetyl-CoA synthase gamma subunit (corrinoid Fe-S protein)
MCLSTTLPLANPPHWGTSVNGGPANGETTAQVAKEVAATNVNDEVEGDSIVVGGNIIRSIETVEDEAGDTIVVGMG